MPKFLMADAIKWHLKVMSWGDAFTIEIAISHTLYVSNAVKSSVNKHLLYGFSHKWFRIPA